jgi:hypothetical protein
MANDTIRRIRTAQAPLQRPRSKRQVKPLSQTGILSTRDANRSIKARKAKEAAADQRRLQKQYKKVHGVDLPQPHTQDSEVSIEAARVAQERGDFFF